MGSATDLINQAEQFANSSPDEYFQTRIFFISKIDYMANKCIEFYSSTLSSIKSKAECEAMKNIYASQNHIKLSNAVEHEVSIVIKVSTVSEFSFYLDTFIESCDRLVRHEIKNTINKLTGDELDSVNKLMNTFIENKPKYNKINQRYLKDNPHIRAYLILEWNDWIKELNNDRANSVHNFKVKQFPLTVTVHYNSLTKSISAPSSIMCGELKIKGKSISEWINQTRNKTFDFVSENSRYLATKGLQ